MAKKPAPAPKREPYTVSSIALADALAHVTHAAAADKYARPILNSVKLEIVPAAGDVPARVRLAATDNYRIAVATLPPVSGEPLPRGAFGFVMRLEDVRQLMALIGKPKVDTPVTFAPGEGISVAITYRPGATFTTVPIDGVYPNFEAVIPKPTTRGKGKPILTVGLNASFLADYAKPFGKNATLRLTFTSALEPILVEIVQAPGFTGALMPVRLTDSTPRR